MRKGASNINQDTPTVVGWIDFPAVIKTHDPLENREEKFMTLSENWSKKSWPRLKTGRAKNQLKQDNSGQKTQDPYEKPVKKSWTVVKPTEIRQGTVEKLTKEVNPVRKLTKKFHDPVGLTRKILSVGKKKYPTVPAENLHPFYCLYW